MRPIHADNFPLLDPSQQDFIAIEEALMALIAPLGHLPEMRFSRRLRQWLRLLEIPAKCTITDGDHQPRGVYFLVSGSVLVGTDLEAQMLLSEILRSGDFLLPHKLFSGGKSLQGMKTAQACRLLFMDTERYQLMLRDFPQAAVLTNLWRDELQERQARRYRELHALGSQARMEWLYARWPDCFRTYTDAVIGAYLGLRRETVCRTKGPIIRKNR